MKSVVMTLMFVGFLAAGVLTFCPQAAPMVYRTFTQPDVRPPAPVLPPPGVRYLARAEDLVFDLTNQARQARGLAPLIKDEELRQAARAFSNDMLVRRFFDHTTPDGVTFDERILERYHHPVYLVGENLWDASGYSYANALWLARMIVADWLNSPGHRANLLSAYFTHLGVGISARGYTIRATQEFVGRRRSFGFGTFFSR